MSLTRKVAFNTFVQIAGRVVTTAISLVLVGTLARYFDIAHFGKYTTIFAYTAFFSTIADFGFFNVLVRELSTGEQEPKKVFNNILTLRTFFAFLVFAVGFIVTFFLNYDQELRLGIGVISLAQFWISLNMTVVGVFQWRHRMDRAVLTDILGRFVILVSVLLLVRSESSLIALMGAYALGNLVNFGLSLFMINREIPVAFTYDSSYWRTLARITLPLGLVSIIGYFYFHVDMIILSLLKDDFNVGIYGASYKIVEILVMLPGIFMGAVFPILTQYVVKKDLRTQSVVQRSFDFLAIAGIPLLAGVFLLSKQIIRIVAGEKFIVSAPANLTFFGHIATSDLVLKILVFALLFSFFTNLFHAMIIALGKQSALVIPNLFFLVFNIVCNYLFIPKYSYIASAFITVVGEVMVLVIPIVLLRRYKMTMPSLAILPKVIIGTVLMSGWVVFMEQYSLLLVVLTASVLYFTVMYFIGGIPKDMVFEIFRINKPESSD